MKQVIFNNNYIEALKDASEFAKGLLADGRITPLVMFKAILDLDENPLYDFLINNTIYYNADYEDAFYSILPDHARIEKNKNNNSKKSKKVKEDNSDETLKIPPGEEKFCFTCNDEKFYYTEEVSYLISKSVIIAQEAKSEIVTERHFLAAVAEKIPKDILSYLRALDADTKVFKSTFSNVESKDKKSNMLSNDLKNFLTVLNDKYEKGTKCPILGRDKECETVWKTLQKKTKRNVILVGEPGVGKSSIAKKITYDIVNGDCPECFKDFYVVSLNVNSLIAGTMYRGQAEEKFQKLVDFLEKTDNVILFIDEIHTILGAGASREGEMDLANALKPILAEDKVRVIGATTEEEYEKYFSKDGALKRRFRSVEVKEPSSKKVYPMLKNAIANLSSYHDVRISKTMVEYIILISACFNYETKNPDRTIDLVDLAMVTAKTDGKTVVDKESVLKNFSICFEQFEKMDYRVKKSTAYHEAGHYLAWRMSDKLKDLEGIAVSIMPAEDYLGITVFDELDNEVTVSPDMDYYIDSIAMRLAGRVAEKMYTDTFSSGASADIEHATKRAYYLVAKYGMIDDFGKNRVYFDTENYSMCSEKVVDNINTEIDKIIEKAYQRAEEILTENEVYLKKLVNQLMRKGILSKKDLDAIFEEKTKIHN